MRDSREFRGGMALIRSVYGETGKSTLDKTTVVGWCTNKAGKGQGTRVPKDFCPCWEPATMKERRTLSQTDQSRQRACSPWPQRGRGGHG